MPRQLRLDVKGVTLPEPVIYMEADRVFELQLKNQVGEIVARLLLTPTPNSKVLVVHLED